VSITGPSAAGTGTVAAPATITGTGAVTVAGPRVAAAGFVGTVPAITGTVAITVGGPQVAAAGVVGGSIALPPWAGRPAQQSRATGRVRLISSRGNRQS
jgi:hypothetical protein